MRRPRIFRDDMWGRYAQQRIETIAKSGGGNGSAWIDGIDRSDPERDIYAPPKREQWGWWWPATIGNIDRVRNLAALMKLSVAPDLDTLLETPPVAGVNGIEPYPHQVAAAEMAITNRRMLLAHDPGLGKTLTALMAAGAVQQWPLVVVCPMSVKPVWVRESQRMAEPPATIRVLEGLTGSPIPPDDMGGMMILNWDILSAWEPYIDPGMLVLDECHAAKTAVAARSRAVVRLAQRTKHLCLMLSGTPLLNRPHELANQLRVMDRLTLLGGEREYIRRYCGGDYSGASNLDELHERLTASGCFQRVRKTEVNDVLRLPAKRKRRVQVTLPDDIMDVYRSAEYGVATALEAADDLYFQAGNQEESTGATAAISADTVPAMIALFAELCANAVAEDKPLVALGRLRQLVAAMKLPYAVTHIMGAMSTGEGSPPNPVVVFGHYKHVTGWLERELRTAGFRVGVIRGGVPAGKRQRAIDAFQEGELDVMVCNIRSAGEGITLHRARRVIMVEQDWTPGRNLQAEERVHRIGQNRAVLAETLIAEDTVDETVWWALARKEKIIRQAIDGKVDTTNPRRAVIEHLRARIDSTKTG